MIREYFTSREAAYEYAANEDGHVYRLPDGRYEVLVLDDED